MRRAANPSIGPEEQPEAEADAAGETVPPARMRGEEREELREAVAQVARHRGDSVLAPPSPEPEANSHSREPPLRLPAISVPVVLPGSCHPIPGLASVPQTAAAATADTALPSSLPFNDRPLLPLRSGGERLGLMPHRDQQPRHAAPDAGSPTVRTLVLLAMLQIALGCTTVLVSFGVMLLSSSSQLKNTYLFWSSCLAILCGILGIVMWKKPVMILAKLLMLLSVICVLLNLTGIILGYQGIQFVSSAHRCDLVDAGENKICSCCEELQPTKCREDSVLKLYHVKSCSLALASLKKLLFALFVLSAFIAVVSVSVAVLCYLQMLTARRLHLSGAQTEAQDHTSDPEDFISPVPPPYYLASLYSRSPQTSCRVFDPNTTQLLYTLGGQTSSDEEFYSLESPPLYEAAQSQNSSEQVDAVQESVSEGSDLWEMSDRQSSQDLCYSDNFSNNDIPYYSNEETSESSSRVSVLPSNTSKVPAGVDRRSYHLLKKWSKSDPVINCQLLQGAMLRFESKKYNEANAPLCAVAQQSSLRGRPRSLDLTDTKRPMMWMTDQSCSMSSDTCELLEKNKLKAASNDTFLEQGTPPSQEATLLDAPVLPFRWQPGLLHLESHSDLST